jgi:hypothetical protein
MQVFIFVEERAVYFLVYLVVTFSKREYTQHLCDPKLNINLSRKLRTKVRKCVMTSHNIIATSSNSVVKPVGAVPN